MELLNPIEEIRNDVIAKVTCKMKDLVGLDEEFNTAIFMEVFLTKKEYQKALK